MTHLFHLWANVGLVLGVVAAYRYAASQSPPIAQLLLAGVLARLVLGLALFWASSENMAWLAHLHSGDGFWQLAPDARSYFRDAAIAATDGLQTVTDWRGSPAFVRILALWLRLVGVHPLSGLTLNIVVYVALMLLLGRAAAPGGTWLRLARPTAVGLSFAPLFLIHSTQPLKDTVFTALVIAVSGAAPLWLTPLTSRRPPSWMWGVAGVGITVGAMYVIAGIRSYFALLTWCALAAALAAFAWTQPRRLATYAMVSIAILVLLWGAYGRGAGLYYVNPVFNIIARWSPGLADWLDGGVATVAPQGRTGALAAMQAAVGVVQSARDGFEATPGATNISINPSLIAGGDPASRSISQRVGQGAIMEFVGLSLLFIPVTVLRATGLISFEGGRGLLLLTDLDTIFVDVVLVALILGIVRHRRTLGLHGAACAYAIGLTAVTTLLLAYVVNNYGTLIRLRMMALVPLLSVPFVTALRRAADLERKGGGDEAPGPVPSLETTVSPALLVLLRCTACGGRLSNGSGQLDCPVCGARTAVEGRIPRFVRDESDEIARRTQQSFGYEWTTFNDWRPSGETNFQQYFGDLDLSSLRDALVLDAGCGMGRHARQIAPHVSHVVAVDFSQAVDAAARNVRECGNVDCVQADVLRLPFAERTFDFVYSLGVLHHIVDTEAALRELSRVTRPGGRIRIYLYWKRSGLSAIMLYAVALARKLTVRLPHPLLKALCLPLSVVLWVGVVLPYRFLSALGVRRHMRWPLALYTRYPFRILYNDQFDRFSAPIEKRYDADGARTFLEGAGLQQITVRAEAGWIAEGIKP